MLPSGRDWTFPVIFIDALPFASDVLTFADEFNLVVLVIEPLNMNLAFVISDARADLDLDHPFEGAVIHRLGYLSARETVRDFSRVTDEFPDAL